MTLGVPNILSELTQYSKIRKYVDISMNNNSANTFLAGEVSQPRQCIGNCRFYYKHAYRDRFPTNCVGPNFEYVRHTACVYRFERFKAQLYHR